MAQRKFFIYSLPRSGSAWLSTFLSMPGSWCYHEPLVCEMTMPLLLSHMNQRPEPAVGAVDTDFHNRPFAQVDDAQYFVIRRDLNAVFRSQIVARMTTWDNDFKKQVDTLNEHVERAKAVEIHHARFHDLGYMREVWDMVTGGLPFDAERASYQMDFNVQHIPIAIGARRMQNLGRTA